MHHRRAALAAALSLLVAVLLPAAVGAHSELVSSDPADGAMLTGPPLEISGDFSEELDTTRSVMELRAPAGGVSRPAACPTEGWRRGWRSSTCRHSLPARTRCAGRP